MSEMTIAKYAKKIGVTKQAIAYRIKKDKHLPGVSSKRQVFNDIWMLTISKLPSESDVKKYFRKK